ncbi:hypothetical protein, partial [Luteimonas huabeiensis]|uniref:hypothetical protein n=1 Tax=Luteimonas huabeiensis TaxID=1244513 RepID=UPI0005BD9193
MDDRTRQLLDRMVAASGRLDGLVAGLPAQLRETQAALRQERQRELEAFQQALAASVQDMQRQSNRILAQAVRGAWLALAALAGAGILLFLAALWLLGREADRLQAARERADAVELQA